MLRARMDAENFLRIADPYLLKCTLYVVARLQSKRPAGGRRTRHCWTLTLIKHFKASPCGRVDAKRKLCSARLLGVVEEDGLGRCEEVSACIASFLGQRAANAYVATLCFL